MRSLEDILEKRKSESRFRSLSANNNLIDFCSNDYLGLARSEILKKNIENELKRFPDYQNGSTGSRLLSGNTGYAEELEQWIADFHRAEAGLIFNSGYDANLGLFSCIAQRNDTILYDELSHASIIDGIRLSLANALTFEHNNLKDLEEKLKQAKGKIFVSVESVYSMDGTLAPLKDIVALTEKYNAALIVDEAHATGVFGKEGRGRVCEEGIEKNVFARIHTFGKALGVHGAIVIGSKTLRDYLINYARPFIYSTALPFHSLVAIRCAYEVMITSPPAFASANLPQARPLQRRGGKSPIMSVIIPGNDEVRRVAKQLQEKGFDVRPIVSPTVPQGKERLRICFHSFNTEEEIDGLFHSLSVIMPSLSGKALA